MPMDLVKYNELLTELTKSDLTHERRHDILAELRTDYKGVVDEHTQLTTDNEKFKTENTDLVTLNSKLFRESASFKKEDQQKIDEKSFSESVTIETLLKGGAI